VIVGKASQLNVPIKQETQFDCESIKKRRKRAESTKANEQSERKGPIVPTLTECVEADPKEKSDIA
jgi:hypothetical protein